jgi:hypothetical protein
MLMRFIDLVPCSTPALEITLPLHYAPDGTVVDCAVIRDDTGWMFETVHFDPDTQRIGKAKSFELPDLPAGASAFAAGMGLLVQQRVFIATHIDDDIPPGTEPVLA